MTRTENHLVRCVECGLPLRLEHKTTAYPESGLDNVQLINVPVWVCDNRHEEYQIPAVEQLHELLTNMILRKPAPLTGKEVRFLRKELGLSAKEFASRIALAPVHLSRIETGGRPVLRRMDLLIRLYVAAARSAKTNRPFPADIEPLVAHLEAWDVGSHRLRHVDHAPPDRQWEAAAA
jgi:DNA-binding transcriptional regulator YiaG